MFKLYLDTCTIQRPLDTQNQTRIRLETEAIIGILAQIQAGHIELISSTVLEFEILQNPLTIRREHSEQVLAQASTIIIVDEAIEQRAIAFTQVGLKIMDALHLATAEAAQADYLCTCDDRFLRKAKQITPLALTIVSPIELIEVIEP